MSRLDNEPDIQTLLAGLQTDMVELKQLQQTGGDAVKTFCAKTANIWDISQTISMLSIVEKTVTFIPSTTSGDKQTAAAYAIEFSSNNGADVYIERLRVTDFKQQKWRVTMVGYGSSIQVKFFVYATGAGSITVV